MSYPHYRLECHEHHDLVRNFGGPRPKIVTLCGSTRFKDEFLAAQRRLTLEGKIVLSVGLFGHADGESFMETPNDQVKHALDQLHMRKIDLADEVFVINVGGYIGDSTRNEIIYAVVREKPITFLEAVTA